jgi:hypothetical protein
MPQGEEDAGLTIEERRKANDQLIRYLKDLMEDGRNDVNGLRRKLASTYWIIIMLSIFMFFIGAVLLSVPAMAAFGGDITELQALIAAGFGIADLTALFFFKPIERIHSLMGDMSQITVAINSYQSQVGLRLFEMNSNQKATVGKAAEHIKEAAKTSIEIIQEYFEAIKC